MSLARKAFAWLGLLVFLAAYAVPDAGYFHSDHHEADAESIVALAGSGEDAWHACAPPDHDCPACLWKTQRDADNLFSGASAALHAAGDDAPARPADLSPLLPRRHASGPARAPPSRA